jgi:hypothetical protein
LALPGLRTDKSTFRPHVESAACIETSFGRLALRGPGNCSDGVAAVPACSYRLKCSSTRACAF